jgi:hypothetical protein
VELYNISDKAISLNGIGLYYADGTTVPNAQAPNTATEDGEWKRISLDGKTIPAKGSFLILGPKQSTAARYQIEDNYGDINDEDFTLSNRAFKVALIQSTEDLTVQNPFTSNDGKPVSGYIDMVGAANDYQGRDLIFGFETEPARNSASEAVRRTDLTDTDNNQGGCLFPLGSEVSVDYDGDFVSIRYATGDSSTNRSINDEELEACKPRNSSEGEWKPFPESEEPEDPVTAGTADSLAGQLLILQAYSSSSDAAGVSHSFVELYNNTDAAIDLDGIGLYYADGTSVSSAQAPNTAASDGNWKRISLDGKSIPAKASFLILSAQQSPTARYQIPVDSGDINAASFTLSNRAFKVALIRNAKTLTAQNPFDMGSGAKAEGYIDMVGAANEYEGRDLIFGFEASPARNSASEAVRRNSLSDTDNNSVDFPSIRYAATGSGSISNELLEVRKPRNSTAGNWDPFAEPEEPVVTEGSPKLMILQANTYGNADGGYESSLVELYNNTDSTIDLGAGNYYLHIGGTGDPGWTAAIALTGTVPSKCSYLIRSTNDVPASTVSIKFLLPSADQTGTFAIINDDFKVAVITGAGQTTLTVANPFTANEGQPVAGYIDMLGCRNATGFEGTASSTSRPQPPRRISLTDTNDNNADFAQYDSRVDRNVTTPGTAGVTEANLYKYWPRNSSAGAWNPITGESPVHPQRRN